MSMKPEELKEARRQLDIERQQLANEWVKLKQERLEFDQERNDNGGEFKLFIGNLDNDTVEEDIRGYTEIYGTLKEVVMLKDSAGKSKRSCFVKFYSQKSADNCLNALNGQIRDKQSTQMMCVRYANPKIVPPTMGTLPPMAMAPLPMPQYNTTQMQPAGMGGYGMSYQTMQAVAPPAMQAPHYDPYAQDPYSQQSAYAPAASYSQPPVARSPYSSPAASTSMYGPARSNGAAAAPLSSGTGRGPEGANLYVNNLAANSTQDDVQTMFADFGNVLSVKVFPGPSYSYGFVSYDSPSSAEYAMSQLNGLQLGDGARRLEVSLKKGGSGGGGGGGRGGSRFSPY